MYADMHHINHWIWVNNITRQLPVLVHTLPFLFPVGLIAHLKRGVPMSFSSRRKRKMIGRLLFTAWGVSRLESPRYGSSKVQSEPKTRIRRDLGRRDLEIRWRDYSDRDMEILQGECFGGDIYFDISQLSVSHFTSLVLEFWEPTRRFAMHTSEPSRSNFTTQSNHYWSRTKEASKQ